MDHPLKMTTYNELNTYDAPQTEQLFLDMEENLLQSELGKGGSNGKDGLGNKDLESIGYEPL